jgi:pimeloyl-ACP methyl ester carboxylesterase
VLLLHGFPYAIDSFAEVAPVLAARGCRVIVPHLRGHGSTRFLDDATPRAGQQAAIGVDVVALMDALRLERAVLAGYDWGGRAACVVAALWPERCAGLVSVNGYLIQDIAAAARPLAPAVESGLWYQFYFQTERGRAGLTAHRREIARTIWLRNSPTWRFDEATLDRHASAFDTPTTWRWCSTRTATAWGSPTGTRRMRTSSGGLRRCRASPCRRSRWTARGRSGAGHRRPLGGRALQRRAPAPRDPGRRPQPARGGAGGLRGRRLGTRREAALSVSVSPSFVNARRPPSRNASHKRSRTATC